MDNLETTVSQNFQDTLRRRRKLEADVVEIRSRLYEMRKEALELCHVHAGQMIAGAFDSASEVLSRALDSMKSRWA